MKSLIRSLIVAVGVTLILGAALALWWCASWLLGHWGMDLYTAGFVPFGVVLVVACIWAGVREARGE